MATKPHNKYKQRIATIKAKMTHKMYHLAPNHGYTFQKRLSNVKITSVTAPLNSGRDVKKGQVTWFDQYVSKLSTYCPNYVTAFKIQQSCFVVKHMDEQISIDKKVLEEILKEVAELKKLANSPVMLCSERKSEKK